MPIVERSTVRLKNAKPRRYSRLLIYDILFSSVIISLPMANILYKIGIKMHLIRRLLTRLRSFDGCALTLATPIE